MPIPLTPTFRDALAARDRTLVGLWTASGSAIASEIMAGSGADMLLVDGEHGPTGIDGLMPLLHAASSYPTTVLVRVPWNDHVIIKQVLDTGAQNVLVPMVSTADQARAAVAAVHYPPRGARGIGSALARSSRWGRIPGYVADAHEQVSLTVQIETADGVANAAEIAAVDGIDAIFIGPADLSGSMGFPGMGAAEPAVANAVLATIAAARAAGTPVGVNAFVEAEADRWIAEAVDFVFVGADVTLMARGAESMVARFGGAQRETDAY